MSPGGSCVIKDGSKFFREKTGEKDEEFEETLYNWIDGVGLGNPMGNPASGVGLVPGFGRADSVLLQSYAPSRFYSGGPSGQNDPDQGLSREDNSP